MKICKNCGRESEEGKIRCPYCGYLFEDEMDHVLREMHLNLKVFKEGLQENGGAAKKADSATSSEAYELMQKNNRGQEELKLEIANLRGQLTAMQGELGRLTVQRTTQGVAPNPAAYPKTSSRYAGTYPSPLPADGVYSQVPESERKETAPVYAETSLRKTRSKRRIVLSVLVLLLLAASIGMFFLPWIKDMFKGIDGVMYTLGKGQEGNLFDVFLGLIQVHDFSQQATLNKVCMNICYYCVRYGVIAYAALLVLEVPVLFSLGGRVGLKVWHRLFAWLAFIVAIALFGVLVWVSGFSALTMYFIGGVGASFLRVLLLGFYK